MFCVEDAGEGLFTSERGNALLVGMERVLR